jgi:hypothetical protein
VKKWKWNGHGIFHNENGNGFIFAKTETKTEEHFPAEQTRKCNFRFWLIWNFHFRVDVDRPIPHIHQMTLSIRTSKAALLKISDHVIASCIRGGFQGLSFPYSIVNQGPC